MATNSRAELSEQTLTRDPVFLFQRKEGKDWKTERVFGTEEEAYQWVQGRLHHYEDGWRTWCVPCEGSLAKLLREQDYHG